MLEDAAFSQGDFSGLAPEITFVTPAGMKKYKKYYELIDAQDTNYIALILYPRFQSPLLNKEHEK